MSMYIVTVVCPDVCWCAGCRGFEGAKPCPPGDPYFHSHIFDAVDAQTARSRAERDFVDSGNGEAVISVVELTPLRRDPFGAACPGSLFEKLCRKEAGWAELSGAIFAQGYRAGTLCKE